MLKSFCALALLASLPISAAILPDYIGDFERGKVTELKAPDAELYKEFGFQAAEQGEYSANSAKFTASAWRFVDSTAALAAYQLRRPADATASALATLAAKTSGGAIVAYGNYVLEFAGHVPTELELNPIYRQLPGLETAALPTLPGFLPSEELIANSQRYVVGPVSLARFEPRIAPSLAAFSLGAEAQLGRYQTPSGELTLVIFNYPTPNMARERQEAFLQTPGTLAKRAGPLVAVVVQPKDADAAERVLGRVQYNVTVTRQRNEKNEAKGLANLVLTGFLLAGIIGGASLLAGIWLGGMKWLTKRLGWYREPEALTVLNLSGKPPGNKP